AIDAELRPEQQLFRARRALGQRTAIDPGNSIFDWGFDAVLCDLDGALVDSVAAGLRRIGAIEVADAPSVTPVPGAHAFFASLPEHRRAVVTSGTPAI